MKRNWHQIQWGDERRFGYQWNSDFGSTNYRKARTMATEVRQEFPNEEIRIVTWTVNDHYGIEDFVCQHVIYEGNLEDIEFWEAYLQEPYLQHSNTTSGRARREDVIDMMDNEWYINWSSGAPVPRKGYVIIDIDSVPWFNGQCPIIKECKIQRD